MVVCSMALNKFVRVCNFFFFKHFYYKDEVSDYIRGFYCSLGELCKNVLVW